MQLSAARSVRPARSSTLKCSAIKAQTPYADELIATAVSEPLVWASKKDNKQKRGRKKTRAPSDGGAAAFLAPFPTFFGRAFALDRRVAAFFRSFSGLDLI